jgi:hypothetical protein
MGVAEITAILDWEIPAPQPHILCGPAQSSGTRILDWILKAWRTVGPTTVSLRRIFM